MMNIEKAINKIEKYLGVVVEKNGHQYAFTYEGKVGRFNVTSDDAHSFHIRRVGDNTCLMSDYFAGYYLKNLTQFLNSLKQPDAKYPAGSLVRGRKNKRALRMGISEKVGVVIEIGSYGSYNILWAGEEGVATYPHERDLECA
jgi:hypothetical protein